MDEGAKLAAEERIRGLPPGSLWTRKPAAKDLVRFPSNSAGPCCRRTVSDASRAWLDDVASRYEVPVVDAVDFDFEPTALTRWMPEEAATFEAADVHSALGYLESALGNERWDAGGCNDDGLSPHLSKPQGCPASILRRPAPEHAGHRSTGDRRCALAGASQIPIIARVHARGRPGVDRSPPARPIEKRWRC